MRKNKDSQVSAILLAAGKSERMGQNKLLMPWEGGTVIGRTLDNLLASRVGEVVVVLGSRAQDISEAVGDRDVTLVLNPNYARGMSTSLATGLGMINHGARYILVALGDQALVTPATYDQLIQAAEEGERGIAVPTFRKKRGNPIVLSSKYIAELARAAGDIGGRELLTKYAGDVREVAVRDEGVVVNINTPEEYARRVTGARARKDDPAQA
jgi:molybdenum cofactor cytidylyltransferase